MLSTVSVALTSDFDALHFLRYLASDEARVNPDPDVVNALAALASSSVISAGFNSGPDSVLASRPLKGPHPPTPLHASSGISEMALPINEAMLPSPSMSHANDYGAAAKCFSSGMRSLRPESDTASLRHESVLWESQRRISDNGLNLPHGGAKIINSACDRNAQLGHEDTVLHELSENKSDPALLGYRVVDAYEGNHMDLSKRQHQSICASKLEYRTAYVSDDDVDGIADTSAQLTLRTSMAKLRIKELTEKVSLIEEVSPGINFGAFV